MSDSRRFEWAGEHGRPVFRRRRHMTTMDALMAGLEGAPSRLAPPAAALVWLGVDPDAAGRRDDDFDLGHRAWRDRAESFPEFRAALAALERLDGEVGRLGLAAAFASRPHSETPVPPSLLPEQDPWQQELAEMTRAERLASVAMGGRGATRYLSLHDAVVIGVARLTAAGVPLDGEGMIARATLAAVRPEEPATVATDSTRLLEWRLRWAMEPERERALLLAESMARHAPRVPELLAELAVSSFAWVAVPDPA